MTEDLWKKGHEFGELKPSREIWKDGLHWFTFEQQQTGLKEINVEDIETGIILSTSLSNPDMRTSSFKAWSGARQSRAPGYPWEIKSEIVGKNIDADAKLDEMFSGFGHASVGDMARIQMDLSNVPMHLCYSIFADAATNSGQEKSTRYQRKFGNSVLHALENYLPPDVVNTTDFLQAKVKYEALGTLSLENFQSLKPLITDTYVEYFKPANDSEKRSLDSRVLDTVRFYLLFGQIGGSTFESSARDFSRIIGDLKASPVAFYRRVGEVMRTFLLTDKEIEEQLGFKAEAPGLIRHTEANSQANNNLLALNRYLVEHDFFKNVGVNLEPAKEVEQNVSLIGSEVPEIDKVVIQSILLLWPGADRKQVTEWVVSRDEATKVGISEIIFRGHNNYAELPIIDSTTSLSLVYRSFLGEIRDLNRHRAWGRFLPLPLVHGLPINVDTVYQILSNGYGLPLYLTGVEDFKEVAEAFRSRMNSYYTELYKFVGLMERSFGDSIDYSFLVNLLPLAHAFEFWMHGNPKQASYLTNQRSRPGGHINYRGLAFDANNLIANSNPYFSGMRLINRPDPSNRKEFFDRS